ncbi:MAG TPA: oxidoreductase, partial [Gammaproteobacteria bacterium]
SMATPRKTRLKVWNRIAGDLKPNKLKLIGHQVVAFDQLPQVFPKILDGRHRGRIVVKIA